MIQGSLEAYYYTTTVLTSSVSMIYDTLHWRRAGPWKSIISYDKDKVGVAPRG